MEKSGVGFDRPPFFMLISCFLAGKVILHLIFVMFVAVHDFF